MRFLACLALALIVCCSSGSPAPGVTVLPGATLPPGAAARFTAHIDHQARTLTFTRVPAAPALTTQSVDSINDPALGGTDDPSPADVDLVSPNGCMFPTGQFQCLVTMIWGGPTRRSCPPPWPNSAGGKTSRSFPKA